ncbi:hypothetical protein CGRA01v4_14792 [Colletotrichum graminicola]|nr:hypothetical protein CGRA01v4_14792 [Colletotrichum graminicola]
MKFGPLSATWFSREKVLLCWESPGRLLGPSLRLVSFPGIIPVFLLSNVS